MTDFVVVAGAGSQMSGLMVPVASSSCSDVLAGIQLVHDQVFNGSEGYAAVSCTNDPVQVGTQIGWSPAWTYTIAGVGSFEAGAFGVADAFDPVVGGGLFAAVVSSVLILYVCSRSAGTILSFLKGLS
jgi:hypothetical protein